MRGRCLRLWVLAALGLATLLTAGTVAVEGQADSFAERLLRRQLRFSASDLRALDAGAAVMQSLETSARQELAHVGAVYVDAPASRFIDLLQTIERFESGPAVPQIGRFRHPPRLEDLAALTLPAADLGALRRCRPGDCDLQLPAPAIQRFRTEVNWSSPGAARRAHEIAREVILTLVRTYQAEGDAALGEYADDAEPMPVARHFHAMLASSRRLPIPPAILAYLEEYPRGRPEGADDLFYWSVVDFGLKPTIRVNHVTMVPLAHGAKSGVTHVVAIKQLYATHYFHTALELRLLVADDRGAGRHGFFLVSVTRSRSDGTTGVRGVLLRPIIHRRSREGVRGYLEHLKRQVEGEGR